MKTIPTQKENPKGLHQRYDIRKVVVESNYIAGLRLEDTITTKPVDPGSEYFVMRLDSGGKDPIHIAACRKAVLVYAEEIKNHLPELSKDLIERYSSQPERETNV